MWLSSGYYRIRFDRSLKLGTICPEWEPFPHETRRNHTSFLFNLAQDYNVDELLNVFDNFDPATIIFLKKLKQVKLTYQRPNGRNRDVTIQRKDFVEDHVSVTTLEADGKKLKYLKCIQRVTNLPQDTKRRNISHSDLVLAFPTTETSQEDAPGRQKVFETLPIGDYGLKVRHLASSIGF